MKHMKNNSVLSTVDFIRTDYKETFPSFTHTGPALPAIKFAQTPEKQA